jgi:hypothetical protein
MNWHRGPDRCLALRRADGTAAIVAHWVGGGYLWIVADPAGRMVNFGGARLQSDAKVAALAALRA